MRRRIIIAATAVLAAVTAAYYVYHLGYLATPSEDYLGNIRPFVKSMIAMNFGDLVNKLLPVYPALLALVSKLFTGRDPVLTAALVINAVLLMPYFIAAYLVFSRFLSKTMTVAALFFLAVNNYTLFAALNPELEMFLAVMTLWTFVLISRSSRCDLLTAAAVAATKWDAVFIVPAVVWKRFFPGLAWRRAFIAGAAASSVFAVWFGYLLFLRFRHPEGGNAYVSEMAQRMPNVYRYLIDAFLVPSGFVQWAGLDVYRSFPSPVSVFIAVTVVVFAVLFLAVIIAGIRFFARTENELRAPIAIYTCGFIFIHMVYQNTKDKYVLPIVWFIVLLAFIGVERWLLPRFVRIMQQRRPSMAVAVLSVFMLLVAAVCVVRTREPALAAAAAALSGAWIAWLYFVPGLRGKVYSAVAAFSVFIIGMDVVYGRVILDHYSKRRVEFKLAGEWFRDNTKPGDVIVASEDSVVQYYSGIPMNNVAMYMYFPSRTLESLDLCLSAVEAKYIYIDDFYIRRLETNDKNAIDRKAPLLKKLKLRIGELPRFTLVKTIQVGTDINGSIYRVNEM